MFSLIFFVLGLIVGSFLNVVVYRLKMAEDIFWDRSKCPHCKSAVSWYDNIPVLSFILLRSRCRHCKKKISWQYPLVEILTGVVFVLVGWKFFRAEDMQTWVETAYYLGAAGFSIVILVYDFLYFEVPMLVLWLGVVWSVGFCLYLDWSQASAMQGILDFRVYSGVLASFVSFLFFFALSAGSREKWMGLGDAYLVLFLGLVVGWPQMLLALFLSFCIGAIFGLGLVALKGKSLKSRIPFAPFLITGAFLAIFFYHPITNWYFSLYAY